MRNCLPFYAVSRQPRRGRFLDDLSRPSPISMRKRSNNRRIQLAVAQRITFLAVPHHYASTTVEADPELVHQYSSLHQPYSTRHMVVSGSSAELSEVQAYTSPHGRRIERCSLETECGCKANHSRSPSLPGIHLLAGL
uniref:Uncharacterized protein n=1 Tax=Trichuris muris TaxID=70415 RepID=A0A5S6Q0P1_TRIMR